ncbi:hypothetical protein F2Q70_00019576 [Brassica cretica]|uniref:Protein kinase domain-containing protein n=1 Tax=Brassica cretica TaxID=69181 RepID=A0A8S9GMD5_BRACR|nr:hypothetical protein F2Q70_00019576 [Brassica cretica]
MVKTLGLDDEEKRGVNLFFYIADESGKVLNLGLQGSSTLVCGSREVDVGNWQLHLKSEAPGLVSHYCGFKTANSVNLSDLVQKNLTENMFGQVKLSDTAEDDSNVYVFQISTMSQFSTIDIAFISGIDEKTADMEDRTNTLAGSQLTTLLAEKHVAFDEKFRECFNLSEEIDAKTLDVGKAAIGNMLGGIGYLYGQSKVYYHKSKHHFLHYWPAELYTAVPCRSKLPWGQLSDEGSHQMLIWRWDFRITLDIVGHWLDLMNVEGWIPREQILGLEALSKIKHDHVQYPDVVNPPTLLLVLCDLIIGIDEKKFNDEESAEIVSFLERAFARLEAWFVPVVIHFPKRISGGFTRTLNLRIMAYYLIKKSLSVDSPRQISFHSSSSFEERTFTPYLLSMEEDDFLASLPSIGFSFTTGLLSCVAMHYDRDHKTYLDFGNHTEKVRLVIEFGRGIRVTDEEPELKKVPHVGYASLFPFMSKIIPPHSEILEQQLDLISSNELVCSDYGLLSLAKTSSLYMTPNALMNQPPCWRGPIWMNINYMILASLKHYSSVEGPYSDKARDIYVKLRNNLISNVVGEYDKTRTSGNVMIKQKELEKVDVTSLDEDEHRLLVYEFMPRASLIIFSGGLAFLHSSETRVIYRDFKTSNILLDSEYNEKLSDFGLAKDGPMGDESHVSRRVMGTHGYAAHEYLATGHLTTKSDVSSFRVVLLELLSGRRAMDRNRPSGERNLGEWAKPYLANKRKILRLWIIVFKISTLWKKHLEHIKSLNASRGGNVDRTERRVRRRNDTVVTKKPDAGFVRQTAVGCTVVAYPLPSTSPLKSSNTSMFLIKLL